jgi:hypothetical protein
VLVTDDNGCVTADSAVVTFFDCTGIEEYPDSRYIELFPNPNTGEFALRSKSAVSGSFELKIYNSLGKTVYSENGVPFEYGFTHPVNLKHLDSGIYLLQLKNKEVEYTKRFIINK